MRNIRRSKKNQFNNINYSEFVLSNILCQSKLLEEIWYAFYIHVYMIGIVLKIMIDIVLKLS